MKNFLIILLSLALVLSAFYHRDTPEPITVNAIGDSLTFGFGSAGLNYTEQLPDDLVVRNYGVGGAATPKMMEHINLDADYIIIWGGINDVYTGVSIEETKFILKSMYRKAHEAGCKVIAVTLPPSKGDPNWTQVKQDNVLKLNKWIMDSEADYKVDVYPLLSDKDFSKYSTDGMHLSEQGYRVVADEISKIF
jgi:lysophospholipase L1-like esterase